MNTNQLQSFALIVAILMISHSTFAFQCPLLESESFFDFYEKVELTDFSKKMKDRNSVRLENYKYKDKIDSLFIYAKAQLKAKLPDSLICSRVSQSNTYTLLTFYKHDITLNFSFVFSDASGGKYGDVLHLSFNHIVKENKNYLTVSPDPNKLPNCKISPELCSFKVTSEHQAKEVARSVGFLSKKENTRVTFSNRQAFAYEITKTIDDDCGRETILIDMYTGNHKIFVERQQINCITWKQKIDNSDVVIDGTVITQKGVKAGRDINTQSTIEVHHLFKGRLAKDTLIVTTLGGTYNGQSQYWSHGQVRMKSIGERAIFFLKIKSNIDSTNLNIASSEYKTNLDPFDIFRTTRNNNKYRLYSEDYFQRIEKIVGRKREVKLQPRIKDSDFIPDDISIPNREKGIALQMGTKYLPEIADSISLYLSMSSINDLVYLDNWSINLEYDTTTFGSYIVKNKNIQKLTMRPLFKNILKYYTFKMIDIKPNTIQLTWNKKNDHINYLELIPLSKQNRFYQPIARLQLKVRNENQAYNLKSEFARPPINYDYDQQKLDSILLTNTPKTISNSLTDYFLPEIISFEPKTAHIGDTITITGKRLDGATPLLYAIKGIAKNHLVVREQFIISQTNDKIKFIIPPYLHYNVKHVDPERDYFEVSSGIINISHKLTNKRIASKEELIIIPNDN